MKRNIFSVFLLIILVLLIAVSVTACEYFTTDEDPDNHPNSPSDDLDDQPLDTSLYLPITSDFEPMITVVSSYSKDKVYADAFNAFTKLFKDAGIKFKYTYSAADDPELPEIIIGGGIGASGDLYVDPHDLGDEGYVIRVIGNKIIVNGGSSESLAKAIEIFSYDILKLDDADTEIGNLYVSRSIDICKRQEYPITSITVANKDLRGYDIVCDIYDEDLKKCADQLHELLYNNAGYWLKVKDRSTSSAIRISIVDYAGDDGFRVYVSGTDLIIECAYPALLVDAFDIFVSSHFTSGAVREESFGGDYLYTYNVSTVSYSDFGAVGDGVTDDFHAIMATHARANITGQTVVADSGKTYYLGRHADSIIISTDTVWTGATFIIDDGDLLPTNPASRTDVFKIQSDTPSYILTAITSLYKGQSNVGLTFDGPMLLHIITYDKKQYIRYGNNADGGSYQQEIVLVDEDGNVDPLTPILWDYPEGTVVRAYSAYDRPITVEGGTFVTVANSAPCEYTYYLRGISVNRSNVTIRNLTHTVTNEGETGAPYNGIFNISLCSNVMIENAVLTGHKVYALASDPTNKMGTYDISISLANLVTFKNCTQTNSIVDTEYWGIMGSNYCKNLTYDSCVLSRFDAHKGTHNATIIGSEIGHQKLSIIGSGVLRVENTIIHGNNVVSLRNDYGSTWDGEMIFKNIVLENTSSTPTLISAAWYNHDFGYTCHLPSKIEIDGIILAKGSTVYVLPSLQNGVNEDTVAGHENKNKIVLTESITVKNVGYNVRISSNTTLFAGVELTVVEE